MILVRDVDDVAGSATFSHRETDRRRLECWGGAWRKASENGER